MIPESNHELPHDLLAERALIGCLIVDNSTFDQITDVNLEVEDFYHKQYGFIFEAVKDLAVDNKPFDLVSICAKLSDMGKLEAIGGQSQIVEILEET